MLGQTGRDISPVFSIPWLTHQQFRIDWLHCCDQGVAADFAGNFFKCVAKRIPGRNNKERTSALWVRLSAWYSAYDIRDKLPCLTVTMIQSSKKAPKLRASAACCRALVPFMHELAMEMLDPGKPEELAVQAAAEALHNCYRTLSASAHFEHGYLMEQSILFAQQYVALSLHASDDLTWRVKPKLHMWLELCQEGSKPSLFWCYRDEDFGGSVAAMSKHRGGKYSAHGMSKRLLQHFLIKQPVVRLA